MTLQKCVDGVMVDMTPDEEAAFLASLPVSVVPPAITYKADIWRRATDDEASQIVTLLSQQTVRKQRLFDDATLLNHGDPDFADLEAAFVAAFGQARADELLAASV